MVQLLGSTSIPALLRIGISYVHRQQWGEAIDTFEQLFDLERDLPLDSSQLLKSLDSLSLLYVQHGDTEGLIECFREMCEVVQELENPQETGVRLVQIGYSLIKFNDFSAAVRCLDRARRAFVQAQDDAGEAVTWYLLGDLYNALGIWKLATDCHKEGLALFEQAGNQEQQAKTLMGIGHALLAQGQFQEAQRTQEKGLAIYKRIGNDHGQASVLIHLGNIHLARQNLTAASKCFEESLQRAQITGDKALIGQALGSLARIYELEERVAEAFDACKRAMSLFQDTGSVDNLGKCYIQAAQLCNRLGDLSMSAGYFEQAWLNILASRPIIPTNVFALVSTIVSVSRELLSQGKLEIVEVLSENLTRASFEMCQNRSPVNMDEAIFSVTIAHAIFEFINTIAKHDSATRNYTHIMEEANLLDKLTNNAWQLSDFVKGFH